MPLIPIKVADEKAKQCNRKWHGVEGWLSLTVRSTYTKQGLRSWSFKEPCASAPWWAQKNKIVRAGLRGENSQQLSRTSRQQVPAWSGLAERYAAGSWKEGVAITLNFAQTLYRSHTTCGAKLLCLQTAPSSEVPPEKTNLKIFADHCTHCTGCAHHQLSHVDIFTPPR